MSYETTEVPVSRSQEGIRKLIMGRKGSRVAFISDPPNEGFEAMVLIDEQPYRIRIMGICKPTPELKQRRYMGRITGHIETTDKFREDFRISEERRIWRVLYFHLKSVFEAAESGVMEFRELMLPYLVTKDNRTIAQHLIPQLERALSGHTKLLTSGTE